QKHGLDLKAWTHGGRKAGVQHGERLDIPEMQIRQLGHWDSSRMRNIIRPVSQNRRPACWPAMGPIRGRADGYLPQLSDLDLSSLHDARIRLISAGGQDTVGYRRTSQGNSALGSQDREPAEVAQ